jgi:hypothetical protein
MEKTKQFDGLILFNPKSENKKTGPIPVSGSPASTCPDVCPFKSHGCYAKYGPIAMWWRRLNNGTIGISWLDFLSRIVNLPAGQLWRHNQFGDLAGENNSIDSVALANLVKANKGRKGFSYTHKPVLNEQDKCSAANRKAIRSANRNGFTINLSANNLNHADTLVNLDIGPVVSIVAADSPDSFKTNAGNRVIVCPAQTRDDITCAKCKLCAQSNRKVIIGFKAHGTGAKYVENQI